jgi:hypothetical protein
MEIFGLVSSIRTITKLIRMMAVKWHAHDGFQDISIYCLSISLFIFFFPLWHGALSTGKKDMDR